MTGQSAPRFAVSIGVWAVALSVYVLAVFHRSSLAVAGLAASERFDISASQLATFTMLQLLVYALMQMPVGLLVDRFGPRTVLLTGLAMMTAAQTLFALADSYALALLARVVVGAGDAMVFICVLRVVSSWFPVRRIPVFTQLTGTVGQLGALAAAAPMTWALGAVGWTRAYLVAAALGLLIGVAVLLVVRDSPEERHVRGPSTSPRALVGGLVEAWRLPGTRLGFWVHFCTPFSANLLTMLWGYPFFVKGEGRTPGEAGLLLSLMVLTFIVAGPVIGWYIGNNPWHRSTIVLSVVAAMVLTWAVVLAWPGSAPMWLLVVLVVVVAIGGPASVIGFDIGRTSNPVERLASATGIINQAGFYATLLLVILVGVVLDWRTPGGGTDYPPEAFTWAMSVQFPFWALGLLQTWRYRRRARSALGGVATQVPATF
ncbi:MFS transporter [Nocardioides ochotonae]|uniref:MFS transporter n=1 Tax=Nocardioides ochotonae TaxID=2685869 RepID=UPI001CD3ECD2|nr:MFS transporter [Nocardioides ochotonae]